MYCFAYHFGLAKTLLSGLIFIAFMFSFGYRAVAEHKANKFLYARVVMNVNREISVYYNGYKGHKHYQLGYQKHVNGLWYPYAAFIDNRKSVYADKKETYANPLKNSEYVEKSSQVSDFDFINGKNTIHVNS